MKAKLLNTQSLAFIIIVIAFVGVVAIQLQKADESRAVLLNNISKQINDHEQSVLDRLPQSNFTAQAQAVATIKEMKEEIAEIKEILVNTTIQ